MAWPVHTGKNIGTFLNAHFALSPEEATGYGLGRAEVFSDTAAKGLCAFLFVQSHCVQDL